MTTERKPTDWMGGSGFVFLDDRYVPYLVRQESSGDWWLYEWRQSTTRFVTMRKIAFNEMLAFRERRLPDAMAALYAPDAGGRP